MLSVNQFRGCLRADFPLNSLSAISRICSVFSRKLCNTSEQLQLVGQVRTCPREDPYARGDLFVHKRLGYRGLILATWEVTVLEHRLQDATSNSQGDGTRKTGNTSSFVRSLNTVVEKLASVNYYSVLIDERDIKQSFEGAHRSTSASLSDDERVTPRRAAISSCLDIGNPFLSLGSGFWIDVVPHDDILPCAFLDTEEHQSFVHPIIEKEKLMEAKDLAVVDGTMPVVARLSPLAEMENWYFSNCTWLEAKVLHRQKSMDVTVDVMPFFRGTLPVMRSSSSVPSTSQKLHSWSFLCRVESDHEQPVGLSSCGFVFGTTTGARVKLPNRFMYRTMWLNKLPSASDHRQALLQFSGSVKLESRNPMMYGRLLIRRGDNGSDFSCIVPTVPLSTNS